MNENDKEFSSADNPIMQDDNEGEKEDPMEEDLEEDDDFDGSSELKGFGVVNEQVQDNDAQEKTMIVGRVDSLEWQKELTRVMGDLQNFD